MKNIRDYHFSKSFVIVLISLIIASGCNINGQTIKASKNVEKEIRDVSFFNSVSVGKAINLCLTQGDEFMVEVIADDNIIPYIKTEVKNDELIIGITGGHKIRNINTMMVNITAPAFLQIKASGASGVCVKNSINQKYLNIITSGASDIKAEVNVSHLEISLSGASDAVIDGYAKSAKISCSGASDLKGYNLNCDNLEVSLSGASDLKITVNEYVSGNASGASNLFLKGNPKTAVSTSGASSVKSK